MKQGIDRLWAGIIGLMLCCLVLFTSGTAQATPPQIAAGAVHTVSLKSDGTVWSWGGNQAGQLGNGTTAQQPSPVQATGLANVTAIAAGGYHTVALKSDGTVWAWGDNRSGQLGDDSLTDHTTPTAVSGLTGVTAIAAGARHTLALKNDGTVWAWGDNTNGQLGDSTTTQRLTPVPVTGLGSVTAIAAGGAFTVALTDNGSVWAWGANNLGQLGNGTTNPSAIPVSVTGLANIVAVTAGGSHALAILNDGTLRAWGANTYGQLGDDTTDTRTTPVSLPNLTGLSIVFITAGETASYAIDSTGLLRAWGNNAHGQLGDGTTTNRLVPTPYAGIADAGIVAAGGSHALVRLFDGTLLSWGNNYSGQLGDGSTSSRTTPVQATDLSSISTIAAGYSHTVARKADGSVWAWGSNNSGQLGDGTATRRYAPVQVPGISTALSLATGDFFTLARLADGTVMSWGDNSYGQLGIGTTTNSSSPAQIADLVNVTAIAAGADHAVALTSDGIVWTWGSNSSGQLGDGTLTNSVTPFLVYDLETVYLQTVTAIAAGDSFTLALKADGTVWAWGNNSSGQLGDGTTANSTFPVKVAGLADVTAIAAGGYHALAIRNDGTLWTWGYNDSGQLGNGTTTSSSTPVQLHDLAGVTAIAAGFTHSVAILQDGTAYAWGDNSSGQLGDGSFTQRLSPTLVATLTGATGISAGSDHSVAVDNAGAVWGWGWDGHGQLGDGYNTTIPRVAAMQLLPEQPEIITTPSSIDAGNTPAGVPTPPQPLTITNNGTADLTISSITLTGSNPSQFSVTLGSCLSLTPTLSPAASCTVMVVFTPITIGSKNATLHITSDAVTTPTLDVPLSGTGIIPYYTLSVSTQGPGSGVVNYSGGPCSGSCASSYPLNTPLQLTPAPESGSRFGAWSGCDAVAGDVCSVTMTAAKSVTATFTPDEGGALPAMAVTPATADFGAVATYASSSTAVFTINNSGDGTLYVMAASLTGADASQFSLQPGSCPSLTPTLPAGSSCTLYVTFTPSATGTKQAILQVTGTDPANPLLTASLTGLAFDPPPMGLVTINGGAGLTNSATVMLAISAFDNSGTVAAMRFSNTNTTWSDWELYGTSKEWSLSPLGGDGSKTVYVQFRDSAGNASGSFADSIMLDSTAPITTITAMPSPLTPATGGSFSFTASETASFLCQLDGGIWSACTSPFVFNNLVDGLHTFSVKATDMAGNGETAPPSYSFTIDATLPETTITGQPAPSSNLPDGSFTFTSPEANAIYQCRLDGSIWGHCYGSFTFGSLADGSHTFSVRAIDRAGNIDQTPATYTWTVDTTPPDSTLAGSASGISATFIVGSPDPSATLQCKLDNGTWGACAGTVVLNGLAEGSHTFSVMATDPVGNSDPTPASYSWTAACSVQVVGGSCYATIGEAVTAAPDGATLQAKAMSFAEEVNCSYQKTLTFSGGFGANFEPPQSGAMTTVTGLTMNDGAMTVENLAIQ